MGFPVYSAHNTPNDFVSCDVSCLGDATGNRGNLSSWLISPKLNMKNGYKISFYSRATDDALYYDPATDRMQVWANYTDGTANVGNSDSGSGSFKKLLRILILTAFIIAREATLPSGLNIPLLFPAFPVMIVYLPVDSLLGISIKMQVYKVAAVHQEVIIVQLL
ncbi:MAG: choice-of-anchor J domain-containing protein [Ginsengibacter sp.]